MNHSSQQHCEPQHRDGYCQSFKWYPASAGQRSVQEVLLDLTFAFDTIDYDMFLPRLKEDYVIMGDVADWIESYLTGCITEWT